MIDELEVKQHLHGESATRSILAKRMLVDEYKIDMVVLSNPKFKVVHDTSTRDYSVAWAVRKKSGGLNKVDYSKIDVQPLDPVRAMLTRKGAEDYRKVASLVTGGLLRKF